MKFSHITDCHLGSWKDPKMQFLNLESFKKSIDESIKQRVDFVFITGDLFDVAIPAVDVIASCAEKLKELNDSKIPCYIIPGSHDFSVSGKTIISVLEKAGLCYEVSYNLESFEENSEKKLNFKKENKYSIFDNKPYYLIGLAGKKSGIEQKEINSFNESIPEDKIKILGLHTTIKELLPKSLQKQVENGNVPTLSAEEILKNEKLKSFDYFALGHIHNKAILEINNKIFAYPGALFPNNFSELVENKIGNFLIVEIDENTHQVKINEFPILIKEICFLEINADNLNSISLKQKIMDLAEKESLNNKIVALKLYGVLENGKISDIDFDAIDSFFESKKIYCLIKNISGLETKEFNIRAKENSGKTVEEVEKNSVENAIEQKVLTADNQQLFENLMKILDVEKVEGETNDVFSNRITTDVVLALNLSSLWD